MATQVITIHPGAPLSAALRKLQRYAIRALPVVEEGVLVGMITAADLHSVGDPEQEIVADHMTLPAVVCRETDPVEIARDLLHRHGIAQVVVLNELGEVVGIADRQDLEGEELKAA